MRKYTTDEIFEKLSIPITFQFQAMIYGAFPNVVTSHQSHPCIIPPYSHRWLSTDRRVPHCSCRWWAACAKRRPHGAEIWGAHKHKASWMRERHLSDHWHKKYALMSLWMGALSRGGRYPNGKGGHSVAPVQKCNICQICIGCASPCGPGFQRFQRGIGTERLGRKPGVGISPPVQVKVHPPPFLPQTAVCYKGDFAHFWDYLPFFAEIL